MKRSRIPLLELWGVMGVIVIPASDVSTVSCSRRAEHVAED